MASQYYLDLEAFSLEKFKRILETEEVMPARQILKEKLDERFRVLSSLGITSLLDLIDALKTKKKVADFAQHSGLSLEYLTILGREARNYKPKVVYLKDMLEVDEENAEKLVSLGIKHSKHLFERAQTKEDREALSAESGVPYPALLELVKLSDLARIRGLGSTFVRLYYEAGADTIETLAQWDPHELFKAVHKINAEKEITETVPPLKDDVQYVAMAKDLPKVIEYE
jgi:hypothetical protein